MIRYCESGCLYTKVAARTSLAAIVAVALLLGLAGTASAHHGIATVGAAGLEGPGAPVETSSSATLPDGSALAYLKLDYADFEKFDRTRSDETKSNSFWIAGLGYGITPYLSGYFFLPYTQKSVEDGPGGNSGIGDASLLGVLGFKYYRGLQLVEANESLDDLEDWHFTVYGGLSFPTGEANVRGPANSGGEISPGFATGFGKPSFTAGLTATKTLTERLSWIQEVSFLRFQSYRYDDGVLRRFGDEFRINQALSYRLFTWPERSARLDLNLEANYLHLERDRSNGHPEQGAGGRIGYLVPGLRAYWRNSSAGLAVKLPIVTDLNEDSLQQGAEGKENFRLIFTISVLQGA